MNYQKRAYEAQEEAENVGADRESIGQSGEAGIRKTNEEAASREEDSAEAEVARLEREGREADSSQEDLDCSNRLLEKTSLLGKPKEKPFTLTPDAGQKDLFTNDKGQIEFDFKPVEPKKDGPIHKQRVGMRSTYGRVKAARWRVDDMDAVASLLSEFKDHAQETLFLITTQAWR
jgi:hypothetical protein